MGYRGKEEEKRETFKSFKVFPHRASSIARNKAAEFSALLAKIAIILCTLNSCYPCKSHFLYPPHPSPQLPSLLTMYLSLPFKNIYASISLFFFTSFFFLLSSLSINFLECFRLCFIFLKHSLSFSLFASGFSPMFLVPIHLYCTLHYEQTH